MRRTPLLPVLIAVLLALPGAASATAPTDVLVLDGQGAVRTVHDRFASPADLPAPRGPIGASVALAGEKKPRVTLLSALRTMAADGTLPADVAQSAADGYRAARHVAGKLKGTRRKELNAVLRNANELAAGDLLTPDRLKVLQLTIDRNAEWWGAHGPVAYGRRIRFPGSLLVWQSYPGQGIQIQWLGTFGRMNQLFLARGHDDELAAMTDEIASYAVQRAGGIAWEYQFHFGGGRPPWVSGLAQATAIQVLARASARLKDPRWIALGRQALGVFRTPPPSGVRLELGDGAHYLAYSYAPGQRIYNAFLQSLIGLHDFAGIANDPTARRLWLAGEREARVEVVQADSGSWSLYQPGVPSDLGYHKVLRDFTRGLCDRLNKDRQREAIRLRDLTQDPGAVLESLDRWPDPEPYCVETQRFNEQLYARLGLYGPAVGAG